MERWMGIQASKYLGWKRYKISLKVQKTLKCTTAPPYLKNNQLPPAPERSSNSTWDRCPASPVPLRNKARLGNAHALPLVFPPPPCSFSMGLLKACSASPPPQSIYHSKLLTLLVPKRHTIQHCWVVSFLIHIFMILPLSIAFTETSWR